MLRHGQFRSGLAKHEFRLPLCFGKGTALAVPLRTDTLRLQPLRDVLGIFSDWLRYSCE
jgi:hypothetical protein